MVKNPGKKLMIAPIRYTRIIIFFALLLSACSANKKIVNNAAATLMANPSINGGHIGISIFDPQAVEYIYRINDEKYFIPASNMKLFTLYAGLKYLGDSIPGMEMLSSEKNMILYGLGDPTFLHPEFPDQPVLNFLLRSNKDLKYDEPRFRTSALGSGWSWDDYSESYLNERSELPVFGNNITFYGTEPFLKAFPLQAIGTTRVVGNDRFFLSVKRSFHSNQFTLYSGKSGRVILTPFITSLPLAMKILADTLKQTISPLELKPDPSSYHRILLNSRPSDSLFVPMMHNSDNFFAEQILQMISRKKFGEFDERRLIDSILKTDLAQLPQPIKWIDGSGLSRYNLISPKSMIYLLDKMIKEFGLEKLKTILPTGGEGTLKNYYSTSTGFIFAKTGTLSNNCSLSGFLITKKNKLLIFSVLANNYMGPATPVRRSVETFLNQIRDKY